MSNAGKSILVAGLCRVFKQDGYRVAPFKSQNMALNSFITHEGLEMGRAQVVQAEACGVEPSVLMNPILLKPVTDMGSQVIVNGEVIGNMKAAEYFAMKKKLVPDVMKAFETLSTENDIIVIEGAGSPAEINLKSDDIVNMGMAKLVKAPVLLVGDVDRGGVFAQLYGTIALLEKDEQDMIKAMVINKFRGDVDILRPGIEMLEKITGNPSAGVLPYLNVDIEDEDSLSERFRNYRPAKIDIAVVRLPRISNFTDFTVLEATSGVSVRYITSTRELKNPDMVVIPGTKNTISDLLWLRQCGLETAIKKLVSNGTVLIGICEDTRCSASALPTNAEPRVAAALPGWGCSPPSRTLKRKNTAPVSAELSSPVKEASSFPALKWTDMRYTWAKRPLRKEQSLLSGFQTAVLTAVPAATYTEAISTVSLIIKAAETPYCPPYAKQRAWTFLSFPPLITQATKRSSITSWLTL